MMNRAVQYTLERSKMKKTLSILVFAVCAFSSSSFADEAPSVVAPAQPATTQNINAAATTTASAGSSLGAREQPSFAKMAMPFLVMLPLLYFMMIRPQQKKMKEHQGLISALKDGDEVITSSGIIGTIQGMSDRVVTLEVAKNVQLKILKSQVNQVVKGPIQEIKA